MRPQLLAGALALATFSKVQGTVATFDADSTVQPLENQGRECEEFKITINKLNTGRVVRADCRTWGSEKDAGYFYTTHEEKLDHTCYEYKVAVDGTDVRPDCLVGGYGGGESAKRELEVRDTEAELSTRSTESLKLAHALPPPKGEDTNKGPPPKHLLKNVQKHIHHLQSQLARIQHGKSHQTPAAPKTLGHTNAGTSSKNSAAPSPLPDHHSPRPKVTPGGPGHPAPQKSPQQRQVLQRLVHEMQSQVAKARFEIHAGDAVDQGVLQGLQTSVHSLQSELAKARFSLHAKTGSREGARQLVDEGFDQGKLQDMQRTANALQSELAKARHSLHGYISA